MTHNLETLLVTENSMQKCQLISLYLAFASESRLVKNIHQLKHSIRIGIQLLSFRFVSNDAEACHFNIQLHLKVLKSFVFRFNSSDKLRQTEKNCHHSASSFDAVNGPLDKQSLVRVLLKEDAEAAVDSFYIFELNFLTISGWKFLSQCLIAIPWRAKITPPIRSPICKEQRTRNRYPAPSTSNQ